MFELVQLYLGLLYLVVKLMDVARCKAFITIGIASKLQIPSCIVVWYPRDLLIISHHPHRLHTHSHVLKNMTMNHPDTCVLDSKSPATPTSINSRFGICSVAVEIGRVTKDWIVASQLFLVLDWIVGSIATSHGLLAL